MENVVGLANALAWPIAIIWLGYLFRSELRSLLERVSEVKYKDFGVTFEKGIAGAEAQLSLTKTGFTFAPEPETLSKIEQLKRIAEVSPRAAIMEAWVLLETTAMQAGVSQGTVIPRASTKLIVEALVNSGKLPESSIELIQTLRVLRNQVAHLPDAVITQDEAERYLEVAVNASEIFRNAIVS